MIVGIGTDIVNKNRIDKIYSKYGKRFIKKILSTEEQMEFNTKKTKEKKVSYLSNNFAGKESIAKALGIGFSLGLTPALIQILRDKNGSPIASLLGSYAKKKHLISISLTDSRDISLGFAIIQD